MKKLLPLILLSLSGCASYSHVRSNADGTHETTSINTLFMTGKASKLTSNVKDGDYSRRISLGSLEGAGDTALIQAIYAAGIEAGKKGAGVP